MINRAAIIGSIAMLVGCASETPDVVIVVSANFEWKALRESIAADGIETSPMGEWFVRDVRFAGGGERVIFFHGGWGKIDAAASTQYVIDRWHPRHLINLGTCGGLHGVANKGDIFLVNEAITYDIEERMGDSSEAIAYYSTRLKVPRTSDATVRTGRILSADRDVRPSDVAMLIEKYKAQIADWESSAIAHVAKRNGTPVYIIRAVSDVVSPTGSELYGNIEGFEVEARTIMKRLIELLADVTLESNDVTTR